MYLHIQFTCTYVFNLNVLTYSIYMYLRVLFTRTYVFYLHVLTYSTSVNSILKTKISSINLNLLFSYIDLQPLHISTQIHCFTLCKLSNEVHYFTAFIKTTTISQDMAFVSRIHNIGN